MKDKLKDFWSFLHEERWAWALFLATFSIFVWIRLIEPAVNDGHWWLLFVTFIVWCFLIGYTAKKYIDIETDKWDED